MRIALVTLAEPGERFVDGTHHSRFAQIAMPSVAACTPSQHDVVLVDEKVEALDPLPEADVVGITVHTALAPKAYELSAQLRARGVFVVLGGPHVTAVPGEAALNADAVVVGDAEDTWPQLLADFEKGKARKVYKSHFPGIENLNSPRYDLMEGKGYKTTAVAHATRGCPFRCEFCSVPNVFGKRYRFRPAKQVAEEVRRMKGTVVMWDDNVMADKEYFLSLCDALRPLKKKWVTQATMLFANDRELIKNAASAGLTGVFLGLESFDKDSLRKAKKGFNKVHRYSQAIQNLHDYGIMAGAGVVFGFDNDDSGVFARSLEAAADIRLDAINFTMLTPFPGTPLYDRAKAEGRILTYDWSKYQPTKYCTIKPTKMTPQELADGHLWALQRFYDAGPVIGRISHAPFRSLHFTWFVNWHYWWVRKTFWMDAEAPGKPNPIPSFVPEPHIPDISEFDEARKPSFAARPDPRSRAGAPLPMVQA